MCFPTVDHIGRSFRDIIINWILLFMIDCEGSIKIVRIINEFLYYLRSNIESCNDIVRCFSTDTSNTDSPFALANWSDEVYKRNLCSYCIYRSNTRCSREANCTVDSSKGHRDIWALQTIQQGPLQLQTWNSR